MAAVHNPNAQLEADVGELLIRLGRLDSERRAHFVALLGSWGHVCGQMASAARDPALSPLLMLLFRSWDFDALRDLAQLVEPQMDVLWIEDDA